MNHVTNFVTSTKYYKISRSSAERSTDGGSFLHEYQSSHTYLFLHTPTHPKPTHKHAQMRSTRANAPHTCRRAMHASKRPARPTHPCQHATKRQRTRIPRPPHHQHTPSRCISTRKRTPHAPHAPTHPRQHATKRQRACNPPA
jgi:hypothetical protein